MSTEITIEEFTDIAIELFSVEKYDFVENVDYFTFHKIMRRKKGVRGASKVIEYYLILDMAKELCMVDNSSLGRAFRKYFIAVDQKFREGVKPIALEDMLIQAK